MKAAALILFLSGCASLSGIDQIEVKRGGWTFTTNCPQSAAVEMILQRGVWSCDAYVKTRF